MSQVKDVVEKCGYENARELVRNNIKNFLRMNFPRCQSCPELQDCDGF